MRVRNIFLSVLVYVGCSTAGFADSSHMSNEEVLSKLPSLDVLAEQIKQNPNDPNLYLERALVNQFKKKLPEAIADYTKAMEFHYEPQGNVDKGQSLFDMRATCHMQMKNWDAAISDLTKAISIAPNQAMSYGNRGSAYCEKKQFALAMNDYTKVLQLDPRQPMAFEGIGEVCFKTRQYARALEYLNRAIAMDNKIGDSYFYRGSTYKALGRKVEADKDFQYAAKLGFKPGEMSMVMMK